MLFGAAMLGVAPVIGDKGGIAAAVVLEAQLVILQALDEGEDGRFVVGQFDGPCGHASILA